VFLFFPDPWHKSRHHKRRIVNEKFRDFLATKLVSGGVIHMATDWQNYADHMADELLSDSRFKSLGNDKGISVKPEYRPKTKFEKRGLRLEHEISDLLFKKR
jgi:tRNA (guanine-N7-)-methyltransferase